MHYRPENTLFVYTDRTYSKYEYLKYVLEKKGINVEGVKTEAYDLAAIATAIKDKIAATLVSSVQSLIFNLTGGTKTMLLAAYQVAAQLNASVIYLQSEKGPNIIASYGWQDHHLILEKEEYIGSHLNLQEVLELQLGPQKDTSGNDIWKINGPLTDAKDGHLFELAIAQALRDHGYEALCGIKGKDDKLDIDVMIGYHNQVGIIEAKTASEGKGGLRGMQQLSTAMRYLRGTYIRQFFVRNSEPSKDQLLMCELLNIRAISLPHYQLGQTALSQEDSNVLTAAIDEVMKPK
jgi:hypothetical protein